MLPELDGVKVDHELKEEFENLKYAKILQGQGANEDPVKYKEKRLQAEIELLENVPLSGEIRDETDLRDLQILMSMKIGIPFCTNVLRVALNFKETKIAR
jgi:hypothetical protein